MLVPVSWVMATWAACRARPLGIGDFRALLACREMVARRARLPIDRAPNYTPAELARLLGVTERRAKASVRRLVAVGLLGWSVDAIGFPPLTEGDALSIDAIGGGRGTLAIPRRLLRFLARGARPALIATALGVLLRCLSRRKAGWDGRGRVKSSWVARAFGVDQRRVKAARRELVALGWLTPESTDQRAENRWGRAYRIDLAWRAPGAPLPPPHPPERREIAPPSVDPDPLPGAKNQDPAARGPAGAWVSGRAGEAPAPERPRWPDPAQAPARPATDGQLAPARALPPPRLEDVRPEDLRDVGRTLALFDQALARGLADPSEAGRLRFLALAEHARAVGTANPGGLFATLLRRGAWGYVTQAEEDVARRRLRQHLHGRADQGGGPAWQTSIPRESGPRLSDDARLVREVRAGLIRSGIYRDPWEAFRARNPGWTRGRWDGALMELGLA